MNTAYSAKGTTYSYKSLQRQFLTNGCCNVKKVLGPDGHVNFAVWNGLSYWLKVLSPNNGENLYDGATVVEELQAEPEEDEAGMYLPNASINLAIEAGYQISESRNEL